MKTHNFSISLFSVLCVLCAGITTDALSATVKTLGGAGTINGTAAASSATRVAPTRAGALRVTPSSARLVTTNNNSATTTSGATTTTAGNQRLSIGKYLGGATTTATVANSASSAGVSDDIDELDERVDFLESVIGSPSTTGGQTLDDRISALETKNVHSSQDGVVVVDANGEVSIDMDELKKEFFGANDGIAMEYDSEHGSIKWGVPNDQGEITEWYTLVDTNDLSGDYVSVDELQDKIDDLGRYALKSDLDALTTRVATLESTIETLTGGSSAGSVASLIAGVVGDLGAYETVQEALAAKQNTLTFDNAPTEDSTNPVTSGGVYTALAAKQNTIDNEHKLPAANVSGLADVATGGDFADLSDVKAKLLANVEIGTVTGTDGNNWVWGYIDGKPQFIRIAGASDSPGGE